ncbi:hypothetical protein [Streptomyces shenzhenensis]|uniref:PASTA domain-containing protein n=1 Tax=Streptomyces shenzhenensis TaxID=943815 RepID=A0A3M0IFV6_9ACTN|nr:hypothetical protein [Streptomyces shenzhenensis]RMB80776.1 hypothetical protein CTZ28_38605 [Streptomyces shenzhenensis]
MRKGPALLTIAVVVALFALSEHARQQRAELPDLHGMTLRAAQLATRDAGFGHLAGADALDRHRVPLWGDNWKVCSQQPRPARYATTTLITVRVVKTTEACPGP